MSNYTEGVVLTGVSLFSADIDRTAEFYKAIGLRLQKSVHGFGPNYNYLDVLEENGIHVIFEIHPLRQGQIASPQNLGFNVVNLPEVVKKLMEMGAPLVRPGMLTRHPEWLSGLTLAEFKDPDGRRVRISQHERTKPA
jgi:catechol 2,3-dioxygenase-like lactoylglutathione lyase family enzyme